ncbi:MAG: ferritin-like domain-containing protein [Deltaproteobacteria bacterium]|nr:ferritin-like domain-containing protein [Deltaproteobacteria bacterium]
MRHRLAAWREHVETLGTIRDGRVLQSLVPSALRGLFFQRGKQGPTTTMPATHEAWFDWTYPADHPELADLTRRAKLGQWNGDDLPWHIDVDLDNPERPLFPIDFVDWKLADELGIRIAEGDRRRLVNDIGAWALAQFLHGEQGALMAAAQVTEAVRNMDGKLYGATQVMDEARHVEVFSRYLAEKVGKLYPVNDNLFTIIDALMTDSRWDMKFLGMQIMIEGLALGAFSTIYHQTREPLLKELLLRVIQDEARHVHFGVVALKSHILQDLGERERHEREDWAFEIAMLMRNRFLAHEVFEEWFEGSVSRPTWKRFVEGSPGMKYFRELMFARLVPNLREIGLLTPRIRPHYEKVGLMRFYEGRAADSWSADELTRAA